MWHWLLYTLTAAAATPDLVELERARAAGAVNVAYASLATEPTPPPQAAPEKQGCPCNGKGYVVRPDGSRWACQCKTCPSGKCPPR
jgi:hypothetical protein